jgi:hypothetical protein
MNKQSQAWLAKFYPVDAMESTKQNAVEHALRKWRGLTSHVLQEYDLYLDDHVVAKRGPNGKTVLEIGADSCSLCHHYLEGDCIKCPLYKALNGRKCDYSAIDDEPLSPYRQFRENGSPDKMIAALEKCLPKTIKKKLETAADLPTFDPCCNLLLLEKEGQQYILARMDVRTPGDGLLYGLINLWDGNRYSDCIVLKAHRKMTPSELKVICGGQPESFKVVKFAKSV